MSNALETILRNHPERVITAADRERIHASCVAYAERRRVARIAKLRAEENNVPGNNSPGFPSIPGENLPVSPDTASDDQVGAA